MPGKKVPQELWGYAIDFLRDDKASLKRCSLVCRGWLPPTRLHLFSTFEVDTRRDPLAEFAKLRDASADILKTPIRRYIRRLRLVLRDADDTLPMLMYPEDALKPIPPLPNVTCLVLEYSRQRAPDTDQYWRRLMTLVPKVTSLELSDILFHSNEDIVSILIALPHLRQLRLDRVFLFSMLSESSDTTSTLDLVPQSIDEVEVDLVTCSPGIIQRLLTAPLGASLRKLVCCLREGHGIEQEIFQSILQRSAGSLEIIELTIKGDYDMDMDDDMAPLEFRENTRLRSVSLTIVQPEYALAPALRYIPSDCLESLTIKFKDDWLRYGGHDTEAVDIILANFTRVCPSLIVTLQIVCVTLADEDGWRKLHIDVENQVDKYFRRLTGVAVGRLVISTIRAFSLTLGF